MVKTLNNAHTCIGVGQTKNTNSFWIATQLGSKLKADPNMSQLINQILFDDFKIETHPKQLYRVRRKSREVNEGKHRLSYNKLPKYLDRHVNAVGPPVFKRLFTCFGASRRGFLQGCRPFIGLDDCHLKGPYGGVLLLQYQWMETVAYSLLYWLLLMGSTMKAVSSFHIICTSGLGLRHKKKDWLLCLTK
ncbi:hypothetical protein CFOL_v3_09760 [Cephalotus follicularis]|uniref:Uncharacterized protein n=1 Tax=Cephalotus follicularis TaxID=3775 RepID=A0A1Q3BE15_CEPFO|nr:hypothetical protein CFOL_v3_09760 [Cephalotus follicularis]